MKTTVKDMIKKLEMAEILKVEIVDGEKIVNRWGFFANQGNGTYAVYKPQTPVCNADDYYMIEDDGPGDINIVKANEINTFLNEISKEIQGIAGSEISIFTPCGWYYDTIA